MKRALLWLGKQFLNTKRFFAHGEAKKEHHSSGIGQFVLLLALTPYIFNLSLFDFGNTQNVASKYQIDPDRFVGLTYEELISDTPSKPARPKIKVSGKQRAYIKKLTGRTPEQMCGIRPSYRVSFFPSARVLVRLQFDPVCRAYQRDLKRYDHQLKRYRRTIQKADAEKARLRNEADEFIFGSHRKPPADHIDIIEMSKSNVTYLLDRMALEDSITEDDNKTIFVPEPIEDTPPKQTPNAAKNDLVSDQGAQAVDVLEKKKPLWDPIVRKVVSANSYHVINYPAWLLGFVLILPVLSVCIKRRAWGLIFFGLAVPTYNYALYLASFIFADRVLIFYQLTSPLFAQIAFIWFLLTGHMKSRAFGVFALILAGSTLLPALLGNLSLIDRSYVSHAGYSVIKAQLPLIIFILIAGIGRLLVRGARENWAILQNLGFGSSLNFAARALVLWIPMAILCLPFFYLTQSVLPKNITNELYKHNVLRFDHRHENGFLDNALQSAAHITDDINFAWHLVIEERKAYLYATDQKLQQLDFRSTVNKHYDQVIPKSLKFEESNSNAFLVGWLVDLVTQETQKSANRSFKKMRNDIKDKLGDLASEKEQQLKRRSGDAKDKVMEELERFKQEGKHIIMANNTSAQSTLWWTINYFQAAHQLAMIFFAFICAKSVMYVFARVTFNQNTGTVFTLADTLNHGAKRPPPLTPQSEIKAKGPAYTIKSDKEETYYISRRFQCRGKAPKIAITQATKSFFARLFNKAYTMNKIVIQKDDADVVCTATKGIEFFEWTLAEGETVVFDYHNFVGISRDLKLSTLISPRISSLLLGRMIYSQATGPGILILMAKGRAEVCDSKSQSGSLPPELMIAMQKETRLHIDSELDIMNIYLSSAYVRPVSGKMLVDVDSQRGAKTGLGRFVRYFVFPH